MTDLLAQLGVPTPAEPPHTERAGKLTKKR